MIVYFGIISYLMITKEKKSQTSSDTSIFTVKETEPDDIALKKALGSMYKLWNDIKNYIHKIYPDGKDEWSFPGQKFGWSFRIKDKKRVIIYLLPRDNFFKAAFVFGEKAFKEVMNSKVNEKIKNELSEVRVFGEGRGIRIDVKSNNTLKDVKTLAEIKISS